MNDLAPDVGWTTLDIPVSGKRAEGTLHVQADKTEGEWRYNRLAATVRPTGEEIQLAAAPNTSQ